MGGGFERQHSRARHAQQQQHEEQHQRHEAQAHVVPSVPCTYVPACSLMMFFSIKATRRQHVSPACGSGSGRLRAQVGCGASGSPVRLLVPLH